MRLHTDVLTEADLLGATKNLPGVYATVTQHGSRDYDRAFEVRLKGNGYTCNSGTSGAGYETGATWDEWGAFIAALYEIDPKARWGTAKYPVYRENNDFHDKTGWRFADHKGQLPADTHKRHKWVWNYGNAYCTKCTAEIYRD